MNVKIKKLHPDAVIPTYAKEHDAGLDITCISRTENSRTIDYDTGIAIEIPTGYVGLIFPRSSIKNKDLILSNCVGVIDSGYRGEIKVCFKRTATPAEEIYNPKDRVAQLIIIESLKINLIETDELSPSERGEGGFGHSGN